MADADYNHDARIYHLAQVARSKLTYEEAVALIQLDRNAIAPAVYALGVKEGEERLLARQRDERERRKLARGRKKWLTSVYFIRSPNAIKIGRSKDPKGRLSVLQTGHSEPLSLAACTPGGSELEGEYHARFAAHRLHREWFAPAPEILAEIDRLTTGTAERGGRV